MKKILLLMLSVFAAIAFADLNGTFEGNTCMTYNDGMSYGTYNYKFENGKLETFLQYYDDDSCSNNKKAKIDPQVLGHYVVIDRQLIGGEEIYELMLTYHHWKGLPKLTITINKNMMKICDANGDSLGLYHRI